MRWRSARGDEREAWGLRSGDVLGLTAGDGDLVRFLVDEVFPPDRAYDYPRALLVAVDADGRPTGLDLRSGEDGHVPVGMPARPVSLSTMGDLGAWLTRNPAETITPGLAMIHPEGRRDRRQPEDAGFQRLPRALPRIAPDGYAVLVDWAELAARLTAREGLRAAPADVPTDRPAPGDGVDLSSTSRVWIPSGGRDPAGYSVQVSPTDDDEDAGSGSGSGDRWCISDWELADALQEPHNVAAEHRLRTALAQRRPDLLPRVDFDSELGCFFAYAQRWDAACAVADLVADLVDESRRDRNG